MACVLAFAGVAAGREGAPFAAGLGAVTEGFFSGAAFAGFGEAGLEGESFGSEVVAFGVCGVLIAGAALGVEPGFVGAGFEGAETGADFDDLD